jgi:dTDP-4-dehydrorhamnose 3,5-epimerase
MNFEKLGIDGAWLITSSIHSDSRGIFHEWFKQEEFQEATGLNFQVAQANMSTSKKGVIRGIHYSLAKVGQAKWITCTSGRVIDVIMDIRPDSNTFKKVIQVEIVARAGHSIFIDTGLGHGFVSIEDDSTVSYLLNSPYSPSEEFNINPLDPELAINWKLNLDSNIGLTLSPKDAQAPTLADRLSQGKLPMLRRIKTT